MALCAQNYQGGIRTAIKNKINTDTAKETRIPSTVGGEAGIVQNLLCLLPKRKTMNPHKTIHVIERPITRSLETSISWSHLAPGNLSIVLTNTHTHGMRIPTAPNSIHAHTLYYIFLDILYWPTRPYFSTLVCNLFYYFPSLSHLYTLSLSLFVSIFSPTSGLRVGNIS